MVKVYLKSREYRDFIHQVAARPDEVHTPSPEADKAWHAHILDTKSYREMCEQVFGPGKFLHHDPSTGKGYCAATVVKE